MKIAIISPNKTHLQEMGRVLEAQPRRVLLIEGGKSKMRSVVEGEQPDVLLVDGMCCDPNELALVEHITTHHPKTAVLLLCATHTPEFLINAMRAGVREVLPSPVSPTALEASIARVTSKLAGLQGTPLGKVLAFVPCKGGSGATFIATNLGYELAESKSVLLIDLNLQFGDALSFVSDVRPPSTLADVARDIARLDASFLHASAVQVAPNFSILAAPDDPSTAMEVKAEHVEAILNVAVMQYEFVILDMIRSLDMLTLRALDRAYRIYPVLQPGLASLRNARKLTSVFKSLSYPDGKCEFIVNRFEKSGDIGLADIRRSLGTDDLRTIPESAKEVNASINRGVPIAKMARSNPVARSLAELAHSLQPKTEESPSMFDRLFRRA